jgi:hypothetical protein
MRMQPTLLAIRLSQGISGRMQTTGKISAMEVTENSLF